MVHDPTQPTVTITPTVTDNDLSVAVAVTDRTLAAAEVITLALSAGPTLKPDQMVTLNATTTTGTVPFDDLAPWQLYPYGDSSTGQYQTYRLCRQWADSDNPATGNHNWCVRPR